MLLLTLFNLNVRLSCTLRLSSSSCYSHVPSFLPASSFLHTYTFTKLLSMSFPVKSSSHCWVTSSDSLMHELKAVHVRSSTWCATGCAMLPSTVVCWESLLNLPTPTAACSCVCVCHWMWLIACPFTFLVTLSIYVTTVFCCVYVCHLM